MIEQAVEELIEGLFADQRAALFGQGIGLGRDSADAQMCQAQSGTSLVADPRAASNSVISAGPVRKTAGSKRSKRSFWKPEGCSGPSPADVAAALETTLDAPASVRASSHLGRSHALETVEREISTIRAGASTMSARNAKMVATPARSPR